MSYSGEGGLPKNREKAIEELNALAKDGNVQALEILEKWSDGKVRERKVELPLIKGEGPAKYPEGYKP
jgi:hypothetical protein